MPKIGRVICLIKGYLKIEKMPWVWCCCIETATIVKKEMVAFAVLRNIDDSISIGKENKTAEGLIILSERDNL